tara:strand:- start:731 stop:1726 length:996 start_codon:yes stop_codon:yes gene_type:complete
MIKKIIKIIISILILIILILVCFFFVGKAPKAEDIKWGVAFSQKHTTNLGLDWQKTYLALLDDLKVKNIKIGTHWDLLEPGDSNYSFQDLDWQIEQAGERQAKVVLVIGMKTPRWPECHIPEWAKDLSKEDREGRVLKLIKEIVSRYKDSSVVSAWQVENEPFFNFGECPDMDEVFLKKEIELVKTLDPDIPVIISDTGEMSFWFKPAKLGDIVGVTTYKKVYSPEFNRYFTLRYPAVFYWRRAKIINSFFGKEVIGVELQTEPWGPKLLYDSPLEEQKKSMDLEQFKKNIEFAKKTGLDQFYLWGAEWWYWMKEKQNDPGIWNEAKILFE